MDERVKRALAQWPDVPDVYGWLKLDRHGQWLLRDETITHPNVSAFINRNYARQDDGGYAFQNGPQKVHVELALTPYIVHLFPGGDWRLHTGAALQADAAYLDGNGQLLFSCGADTAALDDRDLAASLEWFVDAQGRPLPDAQIEQALAGTPGLAFLKLAGGALPLQPIKKSINLGERFTFIARPEQ